MKLLYIDGNDRPHKITSGDELKALINNGLINRDSAVYNHETRKMVTAGSLQGYSEPKTETTYKKDYNWKKTVKTQIRDGNLDDARRIINEARQYTRTQARKKSPAGVKIFLMIIGLIVFISILTNILEREDKTSVKVTTNTVSTENESSDKAIMAKALVAGMDDIKNIFTEYEKAFDNDYDSLIQHFSDDSISYYLSTRVLTDKNLLKRYRDKSNIFKAFIRDLKFRNRKRFLKTKSDINSLDFPEIDNRQLKKELRDRLEAVLETGNDKVNTFYDMEMRVFDIFKEIYRFMLKKAGNYTVDGNTINFDNQSDIDEYNSIYQKILDLSKDEEAWINSRKISGLFSIDTIYAPEKFVSEIMTDR